MLNFLKSTFSKELPKYIEFSKSKEYLTENQIVWCWCEFPAGREWRECIYNRGDFCLKYKHEYFLDYSLHPHRRLTQNVKYFTLNNKKPRNKL